MNDNNNETWTPPDKGCMPAHIRKWAPPQCPVKAVIPLVEVATPENLKSLSNCFAYVQSTNTTYYIDNQHRFIVCWSGTVESNNYNLATNPLNLRNQFLIDQANNRAVYFNKTGGYVILGSGGGEEEPTHLTLSYDASGDWDQDVLPGPDIDYNYNTSSGHSVRSYAVPSPVFHNEKTGVDMSTEDVYNAMIAGEHFIFDGVPVGFFYDTGAPLGQSFKLNGTWNNLKMDAYATYSAGHASYTVDEFSGTLSTSGALSHNAVFSLVLGYGIVHVRIPQGGEDVDEYFLTVDGLFYASAPS